MEENELLEKILANFTVDARVQRKRRVWLSVDKDNLLGICNFVKQLGFDHLSAISVTDWLNEGKFELTYHVWSYTHKILLTIKTKIPRDTPLIPSVFPIWGESAQIHEREMHEMFGVKFGGNPDLSPLFLEDWEGPPPFRKDFDTRKYVCEKYYREEDERERVYFLSKM
ncbi:MAG TPA: NADH-quinone oxidoreductase subunit C [Thermococcus sp.]|uniref:NADH-quinone oxidoreductase subunit C n=1 Tax=candidate division WOR-3 bacterium TaxID=2052148 RepID=A0A7C5I4L2_UNCW3|nr:NADH-quinone oxidoreductase subunit C [Thermococcus sp.]MCD6143784.1 NADH-quinone oxidoreductase subunit C [Thermococcus sp.]RLF84125.1 MAG: NADH-quinone oxidoreductase subunit C [Thermococci archaeon]HDH44815.1 NADH-quinone oxidoreductase subunit C [Thermococcus sp.]HHF58185.1 NADH-quinone oxidoreductase subunit C [candidate division WOR-3 bacterium]